MLWGITTGKSAVELRSPAAGLPYSEGVRTGSPGAAEDSSHTRKAYSQQSQSSRFGDGQGATERARAEPEVRATHSGIAPLSRVPFGKLTNFRERRGGALVAPSNWKRN